jgi:cbb3-type cytochrome oxidase maturation protein
MFRALSAWHFWPAIRHCHMNVIFLLIAASTIVALVFLGAFTWAVRSGQFDDDTSPAVRILGGPTPKAPITDSPVTKQPNTKDAKR